MTDTFYTNDGSSHGNVVKLDTMFLAFGFPLTIQREYNQILLVLVPEELKLYFPYVMMVHDSFMQFASWRDHNMLNIGLLIGDYIHDNFFVLFIECQESDVIGKRSNRL